MRTIEVQRRVLCISEGKAYYRRIESVPVQGSRWLSDGRMRWRVG